MKDEEKEESPRAVTKFDKPSIGFDEEDEEKKEPETTEAEEVKEIDWEDDERWKKPKKESKKKPSADIRKNIEKELAKDKRINALHRLKRFWTESLESEQLTFVKVVNIVSIVFSYLLNFFTAAVIVYLIVDVVLLLRSGFGDLYGAGKVVVEALFLWMVVKIHEKIEA